MPITYRTFRNTDPPHLVDVWRSQPPSRALVQPMTVDLFEALVGSKHYFDPAGIVLAFDDDTPVGFAHAGFGPNDDGSRLAYEMGVTHLVMVRPHHQRHGIGRELLARSEEYLRSRGAGVLYGGGVGHLNGFYVGLYGGSELPGTLDSTPAAQRLFLAAGYREIDRTIVYERETAAFRPPVDRRMMQWRRQAVVRVLPDPPPSSWWEASTYGNFSQIRFELDLCRPEVKRAASCMFWIMESFSSAWGVHAAGLTALETKPEFQRQGLAMFLACEAVHHLRMQGITLVEVQTMQHNSAARALYEKLGFKQVDQGAVYRK